MKKMLLWIIGVLVAIGIVAGIFLGPAMKRMLTVEVTEVDANVRIFLGGGGNSLVLKSADNRQVLLVDSKQGKAAEQVKAYIDSLGPEVQLTIVNTHNHNDHIGGNNLFPNARIIAGNYPDEQWPTGARKPDEKIAVGAEKTIVIGDETALIRNMGQAHTWNDMVVYLTKRKLLVTGDLLFMRMHPVLFQAAGAKVSAWIAVLDQLLQAYDPVLVMPGHGPLTDKNGLQVQKDYFTSMGAALGQEQQLERLKAKYAGYFSLPGISGFDHTRKFIQREKDQPQ